MIIINLSKGRLGADTANLIGGLMVSVIASAAYSRQAMPEAERRPFFLYFDEFHTVTSLALADLLSELRKYGVGLAASTQFSSRIEPVVHEAILGNVGTMIVFRVGATDANILSRQPAADTPQPRDLVNLPNYETFMKLMIAGRQGRVFSARTMAS